MWTKAIRVSFFLKKKEKSCDGATKRGPMKQTKIRYCDEIRRFTTNLDLSGHKTWYSWGGPEISRSCGTSHAWLCVSNPSLYGRNYLSLKKQQHNVVFNRSLLLHGSSRGLKCRFLQKRVDFDFSDVIGERNDSFLFHPCLGRRSKCSSLPTSLNENTTSVRIKPSGPI